MGFGGDKVCLIPLRNRRTKFGREGMSYVLNVLVRNQQLLDTGVEEARGLFRKIRKVKLGGEDNFDIIKSDNLANLLIGNLRYVNWAATLIGVITLLGAAIGLMNIMLVSVAERTREHVFYTIGALPLGSKAGYSYQLGGAGNSNFVDASEIKLYPVSDETWALINGKDTLVTIINSFGTPASSYNVTHPWGKVQLNKLITQGDTIAISYTVINGPTIFDPSTLTFSGVLNINSQYVRHLKGLAMQSLSFQPIHIYPLNWTGFMVEESNLTRSAAPTLTIKSNAYSYGMANTTLNAYPYGDVPQPLQIAAFNQPFSLNFSTLPQSSLYDVENMPGWLLPNWPLGIISGEPTGSIRDWYNFTCLVNVSGFMYVNYKIFVPDVIPTNNGPAHLYLNVGPFDLPQFGEHFRSWANDSLTYGLESQPVPPLWLLIDEQTGELYGRTISGDQGEYTQFIYAQNPFGSKTSMNTTITILNRDPIFDEECFNRMLQVTLGQRENFILSLCVSDPDGDPVVLSIHDSKGKIPGWVSDYTGGVLIVSPTLIDLGVRQLTIVARDPYHGVSTQLMQFEFSLDFWAYLEPPLVGLAVILTIAGIEIVRKRQIKHYSHTLKEEMYSQPFQIRRNILDKDKRESFFREATLMINDIFESAIKGEDSVVRIQELEEKLNLHYRQNSNPISFAEVLFMTDVLTRLQTKLTRLTSIEEENEEIKLEVSRLLYTLSSWLWIYHSALENKKIASAMKISLFSNMLSIVNQAHKGDSYLHFRTMAFTNLAAQTFRFIDDDRSPIGLVFDLATRIFSPADLVGMLTTLASDIFSLWQGDSYFLYLMQYWVNHEEVTQDNLSKIQSIAAKLFGRSMEIDLFIFELYGYLLDKLNDVALLQALYYGRDQREGRQALSMLGIYHIEKANSPLCCKTRNESLRRMKDRLEEILEALPADKQAVIDECRRSMQIREARAHNQRHALCYIPGGSHQDGQSEGLLPQ